MDRPLRLISANPVDALARTVEALLVVAAQPLSVDELAEATADDAERVELALKLLSERYTEGRSGIVLEHVAGGWALRAAREAAEACARLFERPVQRGLSQAALETLAIVAYLGPCSRPERKLARQDPAQLAEVIRLLAVAPPPVSLAHMGLRFPPVAQFVERFRSLLKRRRRFDFDAEVEGLSRVEVAVAFLALLELRKGGEIALDQAAPFAPIRISRANVEREDSEWIVRSA